MVRVEVEREVKIRDPERIGTGWELAFQWCLYVNQDDGSGYHGYRFIWRRPDGSLQAARGQARLLSLRLIRTLMEKAEAEGWGHYDATQIDPVVPCGQTNATRQAVQTLVARGTLQWNGSKPTGYKGVPVKGCAVSETILEERR